MNTEDARGILVSRLESMADQRQWKHQGCTGGDKSLARARLEILHSHPHVFTVLSALRKGYTSPEPVPCLQAPRHVHSENPA